MIKNETMAQELRNDSKVLNFNIRVQQRFYLKSPPTFNAKSFYALCTNAIFRIKAFSVKRDFNIKSLVYTGIKIKI